MFDFVFIEFDIAVLWWIVLVVIVFEVHFITYFINHITTIRKSGIHLTAPSSPVLILP